MSKKLYVIMVALSSLAVTACQSLGERACDMAYDCWLTQKDCQEECRQQAEENKTACLEKAREDEEIRGRIDSKCADAWVEQNECQLEHNKCTDGYLVWDMDACENAFTKAEKACAGVDFNK